MPLFSFQNMAKKWRYQISIIQKWMYEQRLFSVNCVILIEMLKVCLFPFFNLSYYASVVFTKLNVSMAAY